jgi:hypothetical protein
MASTYGNPVSFTKENNVWMLFAKLNFGPNGTVTLDTTQSRGICNAALDQVAFTGATVNSSTSLSSVSSFNGVFAGMTITGPAGELQAATTVGSFSAATKTITLSKQAITTDGAGAYVATGGRYRIQFGQQAGVRLDAYVKLLGYEVKFDVSTGSASGNATQIQIAPQAPNVFIVDNKISVRTIPTTFATNSTDASIALQFGSGIGPGVGFAAAVPADGESCRVVFFLGNSYKSPT